MADNMCREVRTVLFDMDNTLYNFYFAKKEACRRVVELTGRGDPEELLRYFINGPYGFEHHNNIRDYLEDLSIQDDGALLKEACHEYERVKLDSLQPYPGLFETLKRLKDDGISMGIITDAESFHAEKRLKKVGISAFFECVITPDISGARKPAPDTFLCALSRLSAEPETTWVVGDSLRREIEPANRLGMTSVFAQYGDWIKIPFPSIQPDYTIDSLTRLLELIQMKNSQKGQRGL